MTQPLLEGEKKRVTPKPYSQRMATNILPNKVDPIHRQLSEVKSL